MRVAFLLGKRATGDHGPINFAKLNDGRALNGTEAAAFNIARGLAERGHNVHLYCDAAVANIAMCDELAGARVWRADAPRMSGFDAYVAVSEPGLLPAEENGFKVAWHHLADFPDGGGDAADAFVFVSPMHKRLQEMRALGKPLHWIPNSIDRSLFTGGPRRPHTLAWASSPDRGLHRLLEMWPRIRARVPTATLRIYYQIDDYLNRWAGADSDSPFVQRAKYIKSVLNILGRAGEHGVTVMGPVSRRQFCAELSQTEILAYTFEPMDPWSELFCNAVVDACAAGAVPIVSDDGGINSDKFIKAASVIAGRPGDRKGTWVNTIANLLTDDALAESQRPNMQALAAALDYKRIARVWGEFLQRRGDLKLAATVQEYVGGSAASDFAELGLFADRVAAGTEPLTRIEIAKPKLVYVFGQPEPETWRDGMWAAMKLLERDYDVTWVNAQLGEAPPAEGDHVLLAWGDFESPAERACRHLQARVKALQMGGMAAPMGPAANWPIIFAETKWHQQHIQKHAGHPHVLTAFGCNTDIYYPDESAQKVFDWLTVGHWADWKRHHLFMRKPGLKIAIGERYATMNPHQGPPIIEAYLRAGVIVAPYVSPEDLARLYNMASGAYFPASLVGGSERGVLEARACGLHVEIESDNPKLQELLDGPVLSHHDFAQALREGLR